MAATFASTISAFAGSVIRPASEALVDWARANVNDVRRMNTNATTRRTVHTSHSTTDARDYRRIASLSIRKIPQKSDARASSGKVHQHVRDATGLSRGDSRLQLLNRVKNTIWMPRPCAVEVHVCSYSIA